MIAVVDYGVGNLFSLTGSLERVGAQAIVTADPARIGAADAIVLPGVGAFGDAIGKLRDSRLALAVTDAAAAGKPLLGICLGMQLFFDKSCEYGEHRGLGLLRGEIVALSPDVGGRKIPHMGWNSLRLCREKDELLEGAEGAYVYYVHSYYAKNCPDATAWSDYGARVTGAVRKGNIHGLQFHPEKSGEVGLRMLKAFCNLQNCGHVSEKTR